MNAGFFPPLALILAAEQNIFFDSTQAVFFATDSKQLTLKNMLFKRAVASAIIPDRVNKLSFKGISQKMLDHEKIIGIQPEGDRLILFRQGFGIERNQVGILLIQQCDRITFSKSLFIVKG